MSTTRTPSSHTTALHASAMSTQHGHKIGPSLSSPQSQKQQQQRSSRHLPASLEGHPYRASPSSVMTYMDRKTHLSSTGHVHNSNVPHSIKGTPTRHILEHNVVQNHHYGRTIPIDHFHTSLLPSHTPSVLAINNDVQNSTDRSRDGTATHVVAATTTAAISSGHGLVNGQQQQQHRSRHVSPSPSGHDKANRNHDKHVSASSSSPPLIERNHIQGALDPTKHDGMGDDSLTNRATTANTVPATATSSNSNTTVRQTTASRRQGGRINVGTGVHHQDTGTMTEKQRVTHRTVLAADCRPDTEGGDSGNGATNDCRRTIHTVTRKDNPQGMDGRKDEEKNNNHYYGDKCVDAQCIHSSQQTKPTKKSRASAPYHVREDAGCAPTCFVRRQQQQCTPSITIHGDDDHKAVDAIKGTISKTPSPPSSMLPVVDGACEDDVIQVERAYVEQCEKRSHQYEAHHLELMQKLEKHRLLPWANPLSHHALCCPSPLRQQHNVHTPKLGQSTCISSVPPISIDLATSHATHGTMHHPIEEATTSKHHCINDAATGKDCNKNNKTVTLSKHGNAHTSSITQHDGHSCSGKDSEKNHCPPNDSSSFISTTVSDISDEEIRAYWHLYFAYDSERRRTTSRDRGDKQSETATMSSKRGSGHSNMSADSDRTTFATAATTTTTIDTTVDSSKSQIDNRRVAKGIIIKTTDITVPTITTTGTTSYSRPLMVPCIEPHQRQDTSVIVTTTTNNEDDDETTDDDENASSLSESSSSLSSSCILLPPKTNNAVQDDIMVVHSQRKHHDSKSRPGRDVQWHRARSTTQRDDWSCEENTFVDIVTPRDDDKVATLVDKNNLLDISDDAAASTGNATDQDTHATDTVRSKDTFHLPFHSENQHKKSHHLHCNNDGGGHITALSDSNNTRRDNDNVVESPWTDDHADHWEADDPFLKKLLQERQERDHARRRYSPFGQ